MEIYGDPWIVRTMKLEIQTLISLLLVRKSAVSVASPVHRAVPTVKSVSQQSQPIAHRSKIPSNPSRPVSSQVDLSSPGPTVSGLKPPGFSSSSPGGSGLRPPSTRIAKSPLMTMSATPTLKSPTSVNSSSIPSSGLQATADQWIVRRELTS